MPRSVWYAVPPGRIRSSPVTTWVWVPTTALTRPSRCSPRAFFSEVDDPDRRQRLRRFLEQRVGVGERVLDRLHVGPALEVDHGDVGAVEGLVDPPAPARDAGRAVVQRS
jgi:hypothetical protein